MDEAIVSFGECLEEMTPTDSGSAFTLAPQNYDTGDNELRDDAEDQVESGTISSDKNYCSEKYDMLGSSSPSLFKIKLNNVKSSTATSQPEATGNVDICENSPDAPQEKNINNLDGFAATNWADEVAEKVQFETEGPIEPQTPSTFIPGNMYNSNVSSSIESNSKVNYNYQEILDFVNNSWNQVKEKKLSSGASVNYHASNSVANNKAN